MTVTGIILALRVGAMGENRISARGTILTLTDEEVVTRALSQIVAIPTPPAGAPSDSGGRPISYRLKAGYNGGFDPRVPHCASWSYGLRVPTADCIGFALWASGVDRLQPGYAGSRGEWLNCVSLLDDADGGQVFCRPVPFGEARPGDWMIDREHIGVIVRPAAVGYGSSRGLPPLVVDCSPRHGMAAINTGVMWSRACRVVRRKNRPEAAAAAARAPAAPARTEVRASLVRLAAA